MIPPRTGLDDENLRSWIRRSVTLIEPPPCGHDAIARRSFSRMAPAETGHTMGPLPLRARPEKSNVGTPLVRPRARCYPCAAFYGPPMACYTAAHRECTIYFFAVLSLHFPGVQVSIISTLSADFDRQFDYGCHSRRTRDFGVRSHASFSRAISE